MTSNEIKHKTPSKENIAKKLSKNTDLAREHNLKCKECKKISGIDHIMLKKVNDGYLCYDCYTKPQIKG
jgi:hypothetical protein